LESSYKGDKMLETLGSGVEALSNNWEAIIAFALIAIASLDKVVIIALKSVRNIMDAWAETFKKRF